MRPPEVFVRELAPHEGQRLKRVSKQAKHASTRQRASILLASATLTSVPQIARMWMTDEEHVRRVIHDFYPRLARPHAYLRQLPEPDRGDLRGDRRVRVQGRRLPPEPSRGREHARRSPLDRVNRRRRLPRSAAATWTELTRLLRTSTDPTGLRRVEARPRSS